METWADIYHHLSQAWADMVNDGVATYRSAVMASAEANKGSPEQFRPIVEKGLSDLTIINTRLEGMRELLEKSPSILKLPASQRKVFEDRYYALLARYKTLAAPVYANAREAEQGDIPPPTVAALSGDLVGIAPLIALLAGGLVLALVAICALVVFQEYIQELYNETNVHAQELATIDAASREGRTLQDVDVPGTKPRGPLVDASGGGGVGLAVVAVAGVVVVAGGAAAFLLLKR